MKRLKLLLVLVALGFIACDNENVLSDEIVSSNVDSEIIIEEAESVLDDIAIYSDSSFEIASTSKTSTSSKESDSTDKGKRGRSGFFKACADFTVEVTDSTVTKTITFNNECEDFNGNIITGTIIKVKSITDTGKEKSITIDGLSVNGYLINGIKTYSYVSSNANGNKELTSTVDITIETEDGTISKTGTRVVEITAGGDTDTCYDDEKTITGSYTYINESGETFSVEITTALVKPVDCKYIASGIKEYTRPAGVTVLDFGDGICDKYATKTSPDGTVTEVKLGKKRKH